MADHRFLYSDPTYERIRSERSARAAAFVAKVAFWTTIGACGAGVASGSAPAILIAGAGALTWALFKLRASFLLNKYRS